MRLPALLLSTLLLIPQQTPPSAPEVPTPPFEQWLQALIGEAIEEERHNVDDDFDRADPVVF